MSEIKFEKVKEYKEIDFPLPERKTSLSAGYDFVVPKDTIVPSHYFQLIKMIGKRIKSDDFKEEIFETASLKKIIEIGEKAGSFSEEKKVEEILYLIETLPNLLNFIGEKFTFDFEELKEFTKLHNLRATLVPTGVKAKFKKNQKLELVIRSSTPLNTYLLMANSVGIIDADYYNNISNEGHIHFQLINLSPFNIQLKKGDILGQGIISNYEISDNDKTTADRMGGLGSTTV